MEALWKLLEENVEVQDAVGAKDRPPSALGTSASGADGGLPAPPAIRFDQGGLT